MLKVEVGLSGGRAYDIHIGSGLLEAAGEKLAEIARSRQAVIITHARLASADWTNRLLHSLKGAGFGDTPVVTFAAGERFKTLGTMARLYDKLYNLSTTIDRKTLIIALGGGVVGDMAGFAASTYLRGLDYVQIPTTLLAMVDSSVGGKTGVDFREGKNLIGAFHQPRRVLIDLATLCSLPVRERRAGMAEVIKYGVIADPGLLAIVTSEAKRLQSLKGDALLPVIRRSCQIKADVVTQDEVEETGLRAILNFGHTIGHALESATGYRRYRHGEAIAIGMMVAAAIGETVGVTPPEVRPALADALNAHHLPTTLPADVKHDDLLALTGRDKKAERGRARFVLATRLGEVRLIGDVEEKAVREGLRRTTEGVMN